MLFIPAVMFHSSVQTLVYFLCCFFFQPQLRETEVVRISEDKEGEGNQTKKTHFTVPEDQLLSKQNVYLTEEAQIKAVPGNYKARN